ncbi:MAG: universal stress protein [Acidimicrobiales bacterium]
MKVLIALDGSPVSMHAAREAVRLFTSADAEFLVINVARIPTSWIYPAGFGGVAAMPPLELQQLSEHPESEVAVTAAQAGIDDAEVLTDVGDPVTCICAAADEHGVDVVVVGSHDRGVLSRLLDPSVAAGVVRGTYRPVLVVSGTAPEPPATPAS